MLEQSDGVSVRKAINTVVIGIAIGVYLRSVSIRQFLEEREILQQQSRQR